MKHFFLIALLLYSIESFAEVKVTPVKLDTIILPSNVVNIKVIQTAQPSLSTSWGGTFTSIKNTIKNGVNEYTYDVNFIKLRNGVQFNKNTSFKLKDLVDLEIVIKSLKIEVEKDILNKVSSVSNYMVLGNEFMIGYTIVNGKINWMMFLKYNDEESKIEFDNIDLIDKNFNSARVAIEGLVKN